jgi:uncharacterized protein
MPEVIDVHVHFGSPEDATSGCYWSKEFEQQPAYAAMLLLTHNLFKKIGFQNVLDHLLGVIHGSKCVDQSVVLAMDQTYETDGTLRKDKTHLYVPNRFVAGLAKEDPRILFGASVHPYRRDWEAELDFCLQNRAVLCKWIPSTQLIDPSGDQCLPFYRKLAAHNLPLLCHAGPEYAIPTSDKSFNRFNNPIHLRKALDLGVAVIIAHCSLPYFGEFDSGYLDDLQDFLGLFGEADARGWNLYADLSALTGAFRSGYVGKYIVGLPHRRLLFGSDYPIPLSEFSYNRKTPFWKWIGFVLKVMCMKNPLDKNYRLVREMGFDDVFTNAGKLFDSIRYE